MPNRSTTGQLILASYHAYNNHDCEYQPVEFTNNRWYFLQWDDSIEFRGYWAFPNGDIPQGMFNLGWLGHVPKTRTLTTALVEFQDRLGSMSSQSEQGPTADPKSEEDNMDRNPILTKALAETFTLAPVFMDIAEEIETPQDWAHYLPMVVPALHVIQPVGVNPPIRVNLSPPV
jgi:hypothetical protein